MSIKHLLRGLRGVLVAAVLVAPATAVAADNPYERGPEPTTASMAAPLGTYTYFKAGFSDASTPGFGSANVWFPTTTSQKFGVVAIIPGFTGDESQVAWFGPRLASRGFVVITLNASSIIDFPTARGQALRAALKFVVNHPLFKDRVDPTRVAVVGHSMGGGGALEAAKADPTIKTAIGLAPWNTITNWSSLKTPALLLGYTQDTTAPVNDHAVPFYNSMPETNPKAYLQFRTGDHLAPTKSNPLTGTFVAAWLKRFVDNDTRYTKFFCPTALVGQTSLTTYRNTCGTF